MKIKVTIIVCLLLLLYSAEVFELADLVMLYQHRTDVEATLQVVEKGKQEHLVLSKEEFNSLLWLKQNKDFVWKNDVYDLMELIPEADAYILICKKDSKEKKMLARMKKTRRQRKQLVKEQQKKLYTHTFFTFSYPFRPIIGIVFFRCSTTPVDGYSPPLYTPPELEA